MDTLLLNYSHPLTAEQLGRVAELYDGLPEVRVVRVQVDRSRPLAEVAVELAEQAGLKAEEWQTRPIVLNPPALAPVAMALIAELHGRCGGFPELLNIRPAVGRLPRRYEVAEVVSLQAVRDAARGRR